MSPETIVGRPDISNICYLCLVKNGSSRDDLIDCPLKKGSCDWCGVNGLVIPGTIDQISTNEDV